MGLLLINSLFKKTPKAKLFCKIDVKTLRKKNALWEKCTLKTEKLHLNLFTDKNNFKTEKKRLVDFILKTQELGDIYFEGKESHSFEFW